MVTEAMGMDEVTKRVSIEQEQKRQRWIHLQRTEGVPRREENQASSTN